MQHSLDHLRAKHTNAGGAGNLVYDYSVIDIAAEEWMNYTHDFPSGAYEVYLRESLANIATGESILEQVTNDPSQPDQTVKSLGSFLGVLSGFQFRNFALTDGSGTAKIGGPIKLSLQNTYAQFAHIHLNNDGIVSSRKVAA